MFVQEQEMPVVSSDNQQAQSEPHGQNVLKDNAANVFLPDTHIHRYILFVFHHESSL